MTRTLWANLLPLVLLGAAACSDSPSGPGGGDIGAPGDVAVDGALLDGAATDGATDTATDGATDTATDAATDGDAAADVTPDTVGDTATDLVPDGAPDGLTDGAQDSLPDTDTAPDAVMDAVTDTTPDAAPDAMPDALPDAMPDAMPDVAEPQPNFGEVVPVTSNSAYEGGELYGMTVDEDDQVILFWRADVDNDTDDLVISRSDGLVTAFDPPAVVKGGVPDGGITRGGDVVAIDSDLAIVWWDEDPVTGDEQILFRRAALPDLVGADLVLDVQGSVVLYRPHLVFWAPSTLCALWQRDKDVMMACSVDVGVTFGSPVQVDPAGVSATLSAGSFLPTGTMVVSYQGNAGGAGNSIYTRNTDDLGATFTAPVDVGAMAPAGSHVQPTMAPGLAGKIHLAWYRSNIPPNAWHTTTMDGLTWTTPTELPTLKSWVDLKPGRAANIHMSGQDGIAGMPTSDTYYMTSGDDGLSWGTAKPIPMSPDATVNTLEFRAHLEANIVEGWLHIAWWETKPSTITSQQLMVVTVEP